MYVIELMQTQNLKTGNCRYYKIVCDTPRRISKETYDGITIACDGIHSLCTRIKGNIARHYKTCTFYTLESIPNV